jgi:hypothetical protein
MDVIRELSIAARRAVCGCAFGLILIPALATVRGEAGAPVGAVVTAACLAVAVAGFCFLTLWIDPPRLRRVLPPLP